MLFRCNDGKLVEIKRNNFTNDIDYYKKILASKGHITKQENCKEHILKIVK